MLRRVAGALVLMVGVVSVAGAGELDEAVREQLRNRIEAAGFPVRLTVGEDRIHAAVALPQFYERRAYQPAWTDGGQASPQASELVAAVRSADREGLMAAHYHLVSIEKRLGPDAGADRPVSSDGVRSIVDLELLLTDAFLLYSSHLLAGQVNPETLDPEWIANRRSLDMAAVLQQALDAGRIGAALQGLSPPQPGYARLRDALGRYSQLAAAGGWPAIAGGAKIETGDRDERVVLLRRRLFIEGYRVDSAPAANPQQMDAALAAALGAFQAHHGLEPDGIVGPATLKALNVPAADRAHQIALNLERWRWLLEDLGRRYILVNIADFKLVVVEDGRERLEMKIIVGKSYRRSPVFSGLITYLVLNPYWHVPYKIAVADKLPLIQKNPRYLADLHFKVFEGWGGDAREIDPAGVDWGRVTAKNFPYRLRQDPGPQNALGQVKFMFPNRFNVYLHDTPTRDLFNKVSRSFSSGCIRIEKPLAMAEYLLGSDPRWTPEEIAAALGTGKEQTVQLPEPVAVHLLYWTAFSDGDGAVDFRDDIYGRDARLARALESRPGG